jgi:hypothetical protein
MLREPPQAGLVPFHGRVDFRRRKCKIGRGRLNLTKIDKCSRPARSRYLEFKNGGSPDGRQKIAACAVSKIQQDAKETFE